MIDFKDMITQLRGEALRGRRHYLLGNLGTLEWHRGRGAASALTAWPFERADMDGIAVYLDTNAAGSARRLCECLGSIRRLRYLSTCRGMAVKGTTLMQHPSGSHVHDC